MLNHLRNIKGFTMTEVIVVLVILAILAAVAVGRISGDESRLITWQDTVKSHIRYAQSRAMNASVPDDDFVWGIRFQTNAVGGHNYLQYYLFNCPLASTCNPPASVKRFPGVTANTLDATGDRIELGVASVAIPFYLSFNRFGKPFVDQNLQSANALAVNLTLTLLDENGKTKTITLAPETGFMP